MCLDNTYTFLTLNVFFHSHERWYKESLSKSSCFVLLSKTELFFSFLKLLPQIQSPHYCNYSYLLHNQVDLTASYPAGKHDAPNSDKQIIGLPWNALNECAPPRNCLPFVRSKHRLKQTTMHCICWLLNVPFFPEAWMTQETVHVDSLLLVHYC